MATIYYCKICEELIRDEDELPTVGVYCSKRCEKLFEKYGSEKGKKEYKKKGKEDSPVRNLPSDSIPENTKSNVDTRKSKKKLTSNNSDHDDNDTNVIVKNTPSFKTFFGSKNKDKSDNETSDLKKKNDNKNLPKEYEDSLEYFRKRSEIENLRRGDQNDINITKPKEQFNTPSTSLVENQRTPTPPPENQAHIESQTTTQPLYPDLKQNKSPIEEFDNLDINDHEPPPAYDTLYPNLPPPQTLKLEKPLPPEPIEKKPIKTTTNTSQTSNTTNTSSNTSSNNTSPIIPPKVPPKISIPTLNRDTPQLANPYNSNQFPGFPYQFQQFPNSDSFQQFQQFHLHYQQYQQYHQQYHQYQQPQNNAPADTYLQEQASLPSTVYPPPFYTTRFKKNNHT